MRLTLPSSVDRPAIAGRAGGLQSPHRAQFPFIYVLDYIKAVLARTRQKVLFVLIV